MSVSTLVSRLTGFVRTWAMAFALGMTALADAYDIANNLPNMLFELLAGGVLSSVFIPLFMEQLREEGDEGAWKFASYVLNIIVLALGVVALLGTIWPHPFVSTQTFAAVSELQKTQATWLFRFFAVQIVFYGMNLVFAGVLNSYRHFLAPALAPIFNNIVVTITLLGFYVPFRDSNPQLALTGLAVGTTLGVVAMAVAQIPSLVKLGVRYTPRIDWRHPALATVLRKMLPILVYVVTNLVAVTFRNNFALATGEGGQAAIRYAWQFYQLPYGIFAVALATAIFPELAERAANRDMASFRDMFSRGLRTTMVLIIPLAGLMAALSTPIITLYHAGRFTAENIPVVAGVLFWWALALVFFAGYMFVLKTFYSLQDTATPMYTNLVATTLHIALYAGLTTGIGAWSGLGIIGIPIADGIFYCGHMIALLLILRRRIGGIQAHALASTFVKVAVSALLGSGAAWAVYVTTNGLSALSAGLFLVQLALGLSVGLTVAYGAMALLRVPELAGFFARISSRLRRNRDAR